MEHGWLEYEPTKPQVLWEKHKDAMSEDLLREASMSLPNSRQDFTKYAENMTLLLLQLELEAMGTCLKDFGLPIPDNCNRLKKVPRVIQDEMFDDEKQRDVSEMRKRSLNQGQQSAFHTIMKAVLDENHQQRTFFLNAPGGYGKTSY